MEENLGFQGTVARSLDRQRDALDTSVMPKLKEMFHAFHSSYVGLYGVLTQKGIIHDDPYKYEKKISEVTVPSESPFLESEKVDELSIRLSDYESTLDFLNNYYHFALDFLDLNRIRSLVSFVKYIHWDTLSINSSNLITRVLAESVDKVKKGSDALSTGIVVDALTQIERVSKQVLEILKSATAYHRERYKIEIREKVVSKLQIDADAAMNHRQDTLRTVKRRFALELGDTPFFPELIEEILDEDFSPNAEKLRSEVLKRLEVKEEKPQTAKEETSYKQVLLEAVRALCTSGYQLDEMIAKLNDDNDLLKMRRMTFWERIKSWLLKMLQGQDKGQIYDVEYFDVSTSTTKSELVDFPKFLEEVGQKSRLFAAMSLKNSPGYRKLEAAPEEQVFNFLNRNLEDAQLIFRRLTSLDTFFKSEVPRSDRSRLRGIKVELSALKNSIMKANQKKHEYVARREEQEQMKKLGINQNPST